MESVAEGAPRTLVRVFRHFGAIHKLVVLLTVVVDTVPEVAENDRYALSDLGDGFFRLVVRFGFMESPALPRVVARALGELGREDEASRALYVLGRENFMATDRGRMGRIRETLFSWLSRNARSATDYFGIAPEQVVEIGTQIDL